MFKLLSRWFVAAGVVAIGLFLAVSAQAAVLVEDSFLSGANPAAGEYAPGDLVPQNPTVSTFNAAWADGLTTTTPGTFDATATGLTWTGFDATGGAVQYQYASSLANVQAAVRPFTNAVTAPNVIYYMAGLMSFDSSFSTATTSLALTGLLNGEEGTPGYLLLGAQWGFQGNGTGVDAVFRGRSTATGNPTVTNVVAANISPGTHLFVVKLESDYQQVTGGTNSADRVSVWLDPVVGSPEYEMAAATFVKDYANWIDPSTDTTRIVQNVVLRATDVAAGEAVGFDEVRMGARWRDVMPQANPDVVYLRQGYDNDVHLGCGIREGTTSQYGYTDELLVGSSGTNDYRSVLAMGTTAVPDGAIVTDVELTFTVKRVSYVDGTGPIELRLTNPSADMVENEVTWTKINAATNWTTGGGDPQVTVLGSVSQPNAALDVVTFHATPALLAAVQQACDGDELLELVMMAPQAESATTTNFVGFYSDDASNVSYRPLLKITFVPEPGALTLLLGVAALFAARRTRA